MSEKSQVKEYIGNFEQFQSWGSDSFKDLVIRDITDLEGNYIAHTGRHTFVDVSEVEPELIKNLQTNDLLSFKGVCAKDDNGKVFIINITDIKKYR